MMLKDFKKLSKEEKKEITKITTNITKDYLYTVCKEEYIILVNGITTYNCYLTKNNIMVFRYGKHPKQCIVYNELIKEAKTIQVVGCSR